MPLFTICCADRINAGFPGVKSQWLYMPAMETLLAGMRAITQAPWSIRTCHNASKLNRGDVFTWVGFAMALKQPWRELKARGVYTIHFQTEPFVGLSSDKIWSENAAHEVFLPGGPLATVDEIWDYSKHNIAVIQGGYDGIAKRPTFRHIPPGALDSIRNQAERANLLNRSLHGRRRRDMHAHFLGLMYGNRADCVAALNQMRPSPWIHSHGDTWSVAAFLKLLAADDNSLFLNVHKNCNASETMAWPCEAFRFSLLLSVGANVLSESCADEAEYSGLVHFATYGELERSATHIVANDPHHESVADKFAQRFAPARILERAGVPELLASLPALRRHGMR